MSSVDSYLKGVFPKGGVAFQTVSYLAERLEQVKQERFTNKVAANLFFELAKMDENVPNKISAERLTSIEKDMYDFYLNSFNKYMSTFLIFLDLPKNDDQEEPFIFLPEEVELFWAYRGAIESGKVGVLLGEGVGFSCHEWTFGKTSYAVKRLISEQSKEDQKEYLQRNNLLEFQIERHPNILGVTAFLKDGLTYLLVHEKAIGTLHTLFRRSEIPDIGSFQANLTILLGIARGLEFLKDAGVIHYDLKPGNIFVFFQLVVKIGDFNLSRKIGEKCYGGSPAFASLELLTHMKKNPNREFFPEGVGFPTDIWSFGIVLYFLLSGGRDLSCEDSFEDEIEHLFEWLSKAKDQTDLDKSFMDLIDEFNPKWNKDPGNEKIRDVMLSCLKKEPSERIQVEDLVTKLAAMKI